MFLGYHVTLITQKHVTYTKIYLCDVDLILSLPTFADHQQSCWIVAGYHCLFSGWDDFSYFEWGMKSYDSKERLLRENKLGLKRPWNGEKIVPHMDEYLMLNIKSTFIKFKTY